MTRCAGERRPIGRGAGARRGRGSVLPAAAMALLLQGPLLAQSQRPEEAAPETLPRELLEARTVYLMASLFSDLRQHVERELASWGRFEVVELLTEADAVVDLGATRGFVRLPVGEECDEEGDADPLCDRPVATTPVFDAFRVQIFVPGGPTLWKDEVAIEHDHEAARILIDRVRSAIEAVETDQGAS